MKNFILILAMLITGLTINSLKAQGSWTLQTNPLGSDNMAMLGKIQFVSPTEGWISVSSGGLLHTTNGGLNWTVQTPFPNESVWSLSDPDINMCFINKTMGWLIKSFGTSEIDLHGVVVYKTTNGGNNWQRIVLSQNTPNDLGLQIQFVDANNGWASIYNFSNGNFTFLKSTDGGNNWSQIPTSTPVFSGFFFNFVDNNNGWAFKVGPGLQPPYTIIHTTDGGLNWTEQYNDATAGELNTIRFTDINNGWVIGMNNKILKTVNGGATWQKITNTGLSNDYNPKCIFFLDANNGWIGSKRENSSDNAIILHTTNGGSSWEIQSTPSPESIFSIFFWNQNSGWFTADYGMIARFYNPLGIKENSANKFISIYPNPSNGKFCIDLKEPKSKMEVEIYNVLGQKIYKSSTRTPLPINEINFSCHPKGVYLIKINDGENNYSEKIMIK